MTDTPTPFSTIELKAIARAQKVLLLTALAGVFLIPLIFHLIIHDAKSINTVIKIVSGGVIGFGVYRMAIALKKSEIIWAIGGMIPVLNLFVLLVLLSQSTKILQAAGLSVGLFGINSSELKRFDQGIVTSQTLSSSRNGRVRSFIILLFVFVIFALFAYSIFSGREVRNSIITGSSPLLNVVAIYFIYVAIAAPVWFLFPISCPNCKKRYMIWQKQCTNCPS